MVILIWVPLDKSPSWSINPLSGETTLNASKSALKLNPKSFCSDKLFFLIRLISFNCALLFGFTSLPSSFATIIDPKFDAFGFSWLVSLGSQVIAFSKSSALLIGNEAIWSAFLSGIPSLSKSSSSNNVSTAVGIPSWSGVSLTSIVVLYGP